MATITGNFLVNGLRGMVGKTLVFRVVRGKTVVGNRPAPPKRQSAQQKANRSKFREATVYAKHVLKDPVRKTYYQKKATRLKLPNAYTAAITDYMRNPKLMLEDAPSGGKSVKISKKDFSLCKVEVVKKDNQGIVQVLRAAIAINDYQWQTTLADDEGLLIWDDAGNRFSYPLIGIC